MIKQGYVYIITNKNHTVLYAGATTDLKRRISEHKKKKNLNSFSAKYNCEKLIWFKIFENCEEAFKYEKYLKGKSRVYKVELINKLNSEWKDLWCDVKDL